MVAAIAATLVVAAGFHAYRVARVGSGPSSFAAAFSSRAARPKTSRPTSPVPATSCCASSGRRSTPTKGA